jgi:hypothetical protein
MHLARECLVNYRGKVHQYCISAAPTWNVAVIFLFLDPSRHRGVDSNDQPLWLPAHLAGTR